MNIDKAIDDPGKYEIVVGTERVGDSVPDGKDQFYHLTQHISLSSSQAPPSLALCFPYLRRKQARERFAL